MSPTLAAHVFCAATMFAIVFQIALAAGAPWGHLAMGGRYPGRFPNHLRVAAAVQAAVLATFIAIVYASARIWVIDGVSEPYIWLVVALCGLSLVMNLITPSKWERILWAPVALMMYTSSLVVALAW